MKYKTSSVIISLLISVLATAKVDMSKANLLWGKASTIKTSNSIEIKTTNEDNYFLSIEMSELKLNLKEDNFLFDFKLDEINNLQGLEIRFSDKKNSHSYYSYTIPYFTDLEFNYFKTNEWSTNSLSLANMKAINNPAVDIKFVSFFLFTKERPITFSVRNLSKSKKPDEGIVSITFDDGYKSQLLAAKIMNKYNQKGTAYIMPRNIGESGLMDLKQIKEMKSYGWDIQSHHAIPFTEMTTKALEVELGFGLDYLKKNQLIGSSQHLAYPLGKHNHSIVETTRAFFKTARLAGGGIETLPPADLMRLKTFNVLMTTTPDELKAVIDKTKENKQWLILMFHYLKEKPSNNLEYTPKNFTEFCKILSESKIDVLTLDQVSKKYLK